MKKEIPYGRWNSPISAEMVSKGVKHLDYLEIDTSGIYWIERRPVEEGWRVLVRASLDRTIQEISPPGYSLRSKVHEYGGLPYALGEGVIYFSNDKDQRLYCQKGDQVFPLTDGRLRLAEPIVSSRGIIAVAEEHQANAVENFLVWIDAETGECQRLTSGHDFYAAPVLSLDQNKLAWLTWDHPNMPWDGTQLWTAEFNNGSLSTPRCIAGGLHESILQPQWSPDGLLYYLSDKNGWWNLYCHEREEDRHARPLFPLNAEFGQPAWALGQHTWGFAGSDVIAAFQQSGVWRIVHIPRDGNVKPYFLPSILD